MSPRAPGRTDRKRERYTIIVVPDGVSRVRRFHVGRTSLQHLAAFGALLACLLLVGLVDWARLRIDAVDVERLRLETRAQGEQVARFADQVNALEQRLAALQEFERKVRVIANLPHATEHTHGEEDAPALGGGGEDEAAEEPSARTSPARLPPAPGAVLHPAPAGASLVAFPSSEATVLAHLRQRARTLAEASLVREESMRALLAQVEGKSRQLAATPSIWPTEGWLTSRFGRRVSPFTGRPQFHAGLDIASPFGTAVVAPGRGKVHFVGRKGALGRSVQIDHGWGIRTTYGHLAEILVRKGQEVERGERIGSVGSSGRSTGPHLHYAVEVRSKAVDPLDYVFE